MAVSKKDNPTVWGIYSSLRAASALTLALATFVAVVALSAGTARAPAAAEAPVPAGPVCFYQNGYPTCVERPAPLPESASAGPAEADPAEADPAEADPAEALLSALLAGPSPDERAQGIESALPPGTQLVSVQATERAITVRLAFPGDYWRLPLADLALASDAIVEQIAQTLFPLDYRDFHVQAEDPFTPGTFRPLSTYLPPITIPSKTPSTQYPTIVPPFGAKPLAPHARAGGSGIPNPQSPISNPRSEAEGDPKPHSGALSGKTIYVSAGHGWQWNGYNWRTQRPPYPDSSTGYVGPIIEDHNNAEVVNQYLLRYLWNAGADVWTVRERDLNTFEQVVDDDSAGLVAQGAWETVDSSGYLSRYLTATTALSATAAITWSTDPLPADGVYALYIWYTPGPDRTDDAHYTVQHAGGTTELNVDQRHHGYTWRYVGCFPVRAGEPLIVRLSNQSQSATPGQIVVADALRLGGGQFDDGDLAINGGPVETDAPYAPEKPWWESAAYYNVQRLGMDPDDFSYFNDVVARPLWARWEHGESGDDAIYVSWHTNGYNGHNDIVWGTVSFIHSYQPVTGSADLRHAIHSELINDARAGWDPTWRDLGEASKDLGELRELWDDDPAHAIPGVLLEIAYHDHVGDTDALKDPRFALLSARAVYQGIVKYYGADLPLLPEPPTHLTVRNSSAGLATGGSAGLAAGAGPGQVTLNWRPSPTDSVGLLGDAAESYRVYTSRDGFGWDGGQSTVSATHTLTGLQENELIFVRVSAVNAGGESFPTPVLAARVSPNGVGQILIVDGFDRVDRHGLILENDPTEGTNARLFPDQINSFDYVIEHGTAISFPFDSAVNEAVADGDLSLMLYNVVDWILGEESSVDHTFDVDEQAALAAYLDSEGALFISGAEIGWDLVHKGNGPDFYHTYLGADWSGDDANTYRVMPAGEGIFAGLGAITFRDNYDADYPDQLTPLDGSAALDYAGGDGGVAGIQYHAGGCRRVVYLGFPFETISATLRSAVMERVLGYLGTDGCLCVTPQTAITTPVSSGAFNSVPDFGGTAVGLYPIERVDVQISAPDGRYWNGQGWVTATRWLTAVGLVAWGYPLPPSVLTGSSQITILEQGEYSLLARAWDTATLSDTVPALTRFIYDTISPTAPTLVAPANGITLTGGPSAFVWRGPSPLSDTGSALGYHLQIDAQHFTPAVTTYIPSGWFASGIHTWRVRAFDAAGNRSPWTSDWTFFTEHLKLYLPVMLKRQTEEPPACVDVIVNGGFETDEGWIINNTPLPAAYGGAESHSGARSMRLGIVPPQPGGGSRSFSSVDQTLPVPDGISATLTFWLYPFNENDDDDLQYFGLYDGEGVWTLLWSARLNSQDWVTRQVDLTPFVGQIINLRFSVKNDGDDDTTALYIDDVCLEVCSQ